MKLSFDTESDKVEDLIEVFKMLHSALERRGVKIVNEEQKKEQQQSNNSQQEQHAPQSGKTSGGGRVIPYQDMTDKLSDIFSNQPLRKSR